MDNPSTGIVLDYNTVRKLYKEIGRCYRSKLTFLEMYYELVEEDAKTNNVSNKIFAAPVDNVKLMTDTRASNDSKLLHLFAVVSSHTFVSGRAHVVSVLTYNDVVTNTAFQRSADLLKRVVVPKQCFSARYLKWLESSDNKENSSLPPPKPKRPVLGLREQSTARLTANENAGQSEVNTCAKLCPPADENAGKSHPKKRAKLPNNNQLCANVGRTASNPTPPSTLSASGNCSWSLEKYSDVSGEELLNFLKKALAIMSNSAEKTSLFQSVIFDKAIDFTDHFLERPEEVLALFRNSSVPTPKALETFLSVVVKEAKYAPRYRQIILSILKLTETDSS